MQPFAVSAALILGAALSACSSVEPPRPEADPNRPPPGAPAPAPVPPGRPVATPAPGPAPVAPMRVRTMHDVQQRLLELGYDPGPVDGMAGPATRAALGAFQKDRGLRPTGRMDSPTREALSAGR